MIEGFKPMLAATVEDITRDVRGPVYVSMKYDGVRAIVMGGVVYSRKLKPIPNARVQRLFGLKKFEGWDGELIVGEPYGDGVYNRTVSGVMTADGEPDVQFYVFDIVKQDVAYRQRYAMLVDRVEDLSATHQVLGVKHTLLPDDDDQQMMLDMYENSAVRTGYEGLMLNAQEGLYKFGRSTLRQGFLMKWKRFADAEAVIIGFEEQMTNTNVLQQDERGYAKRTSHKAGKVGKGTLGAFKVRDVKTGVEFTIGTGEGLDATLRQGIWNTRPAWLGQTVKYRYQPTGVKIAPRFPIWIGMRPEGA